MSSDSIAFGYTSFGVNSSRVCALCSIGLRLLALSFVAVATLTEARLLAGRVRFDAI
jgi:hypothetical protein